MPSSMSGILSSSVSSVEYSTATFRDLQVWSAEDRVEEAVSITPFPLSRCPWLLCALAALSLPLRL